MLGEEFRRYKVQTSIAQKQRDAQLKNAPSMSFPTRLTSNGGADKAAADGGERSVSPSISRSGSGGMSAAVVGSDQEVARWKSAYEKAVAENEHLRSRGEEAAQASQWRERFEMCERERNEALDRLHSLLEPDAGVGTGRTSGGGEQNYDSKRHDLLGPGAIYQRYLSLKEEFEVRSIGMWICLMYETFDIYDI